MGDKTRVRVPKGIRAIGELAFADREDLEEVVLPRGVREIHREAFSNCRSLRSVTLPGTVKSIGDFAFQGCLSLKELRLPADTSLGEGVFWLCRSLRELTLPAKLPYIPDHLLHFCTSLARVELPQTTLWIGDFAFCGTPISSLTLPEGLQIIGSCAFNDCKKLKTLTLPDSLQSVGESAFSGSGLTALTLPAGVGEVGNFAFAECDKLKDLRFLGNVSLKPLSFGFRLTPALEKQLGRLWPRMTDGTLKEYVLTAQGWAALSRAEKAALFLARHGQSLLPLYRSLMDKREAGAIAGVLLDTWQEAGPVKGKGALAAFRGLFGGELSPQVQDRFSAILGQGPRKTGAKRGPVLKEVRSGALQKRLVAEDGLVRLEYLADTDRAKVNLGFILGKDTPETRTAAAGWSLNGLTSDPRNGLGLLLSRTLEPDEAGEVLADQAEIAGCTGICDTDLSIVEGRLIYTVDACSPGCLGSARLDLGAATPARTKAMTGAVGRFTENWLLNYSWSVKHAYIDNDCYEDWPPEEEED